MKFLFKHITPSDGLTGSMVTCVTKDSHGFVWIGTSSGLNRYDGYRLRTYTAMSENNSSLPDSYILSVQEDIDGLLWLRTSSGYVVMDPSTETFDRVVVMRLKERGIDVGNAVEGMVIFIDRIRNMWVTVPDKGLYYYKSQTKQQYFFPFGDTNRELPPGIVMTMSDSGEGGVLLAYRDGTVVSVNGETGRINKWDYVPRQPGAPTGTFRAFRDSRKNLWVYSPMEVFRMDAATGQWTRGLVPIMQQMGWSEQLAHDVVHGMDESKTGLLWIGTARSGLFGIDTGTGRVIAHLVNLQDDARSLAGNNLQTVYVDPEGQLWAGTSRRGLSRWYPSFYLFDSGSVGDVNGMSFAPDGALWVATHNHGLLCLDNTGRRSFDGLIDNSMRSVLVGRDGTVWAGSPHYGLSSISPSGVVKNFVPVAGGKDCLQNGDIEDIAQDQHGNIWLATFGGGLQCYNPQKGTFALFNVAGGRLPSDFVTCLYIRGNRLLVGTASGVVDMNLSNNQSQVITGTRNGEQRFSSNAVTQVLLDSRGMLWIGTRDGLNIYNPHTDRLKVVSRGSQLVNNVIQGLEEDGSGNVWITTARGANRIALHEDAAEDIGYRLLPTFYSVADGLQNVDFNLGAITVSPRGIVYMGGPQGFSYRIEDWQRKSLVEQIARTDSVMAVHFAHHQLPQVEVLFSGLSVEGEDIKRGRRVLGKVVIDRDLNRATEIHLPYERRACTLQLAVSSLVLAKHPQFLCRLSDKGDRWLPADAVTHSLELYLSPGRHHLEVKAVADGTIALGPAHAIDIVVSYPVWMSAWAIVLYVMVLAVVLYFVYLLQPRLRSYLRRRRDAIKKLEDRERTINELAQNMRQQVVPMVSSIARLRENVDEDGMEELSGLQHSARTLMQQLNEMRIGVASYLDRMEADVLVDDDTEVEIDPELYRANRKAASRGVVMVSDDGIEPAGGNTPKVRLRSVVLVEPDADMAEFIDDCLKGSFDIKCFTALDKAEEALQQMRPDVIVLSHTMPDDEDAGSRLCERLKNERSTQNVPVILATDSVLGQAEMQRNRVTLLADDYVAKPFNLQTLAWRIERLYDEAGAGTPPVDDTMLDADAMCSAAADLLRQQVDAYVQENISRTNLSLDEMSRVLDQPRGQLFRRVQRITGMAPADYIRHLRLVEAAKLLQSGYLTSEEVCVATGFANKAVFTRFFKDEYGVAPSNYHG